MTTGHKTKYRYYCETENKWIDEEKLNTDPIPTTCKNNVGHSLKTDSLHIHNTHDLSYCIIKPMSGVENHSTTGLNTETMTLVDVARRLYVLEQCALQKGLMQEE